MTIHDRASLSAALRLAIDLEVSVTLQYLYAAYSLPNFTSGLEYVRRGLWTPAELSAICGDGAEARDYGWRGVLLDVAHEEMIHYLVANNLLMALGEPFHPGIPRFGAAEDSLNGVEMSLEAFNHASLKRFIELERPHSPTLEHQTGAPPAFVSISDLYRQIRAAFVQMPEAIQVRKGAAGGEHHLFLGEDLNEHHPDYQMQVDDLPSALFGIDVVVAQGEGGSQRFDCTGQSHFDRFVRIAREYAAFCDTRRRPTWTPAYPAIKNPTVSSCRAGRRYVAAAPARAVMRIANECYAISVSLMVLHFNRAPRSLRRSKLMNASIDFMTGLLRPIATTLMTMSSGLDDATAGPSFELAETLKSNQCLEDGLRRIAAQCRYLAEDARQLRPWIRRAQVELLEFYADYFENYAQGKLPPDR